MTGNLGFCYHTRLIARAATISQLINLLICIKLNYYDNRLIVPFIYLASMAKHFSSPNVRICCLYLFSINETI